MKQYLAFIFLILSIGLVYADTIQDTTIHLKIYNTTLEFTNPDYSGNNQNVSLTINNSLINLFEQDFSILFIKNETVDKSIVEKYAECIAAKGACETEKSQFNMAWSNCKIDLETCNSNNNQSVKDQLSSCISEKQRLQIDLESETKKYTDCDTARKGTSNTWIFAGLGGGGIVFVIMMFVTGKWGNQGKDKSEEEFNPQRGM
jgi:hypothetical protein